MAIYRPIAETKTRVLVGKMILAIPDLIKKLAPNGIESSSISYMRPRTLEQEYNEYRKQRAAKYKRNRQTNAIGNNLFGMLRPAYLKSFEEFKMTFKPVNEHIPAEMIYLLQVTLSHIFDAECVVFNDQYRSYSLGALPSFMYRKIVNDLQIMQKDYMRRYSLRNLPSMDKIDLIPIYEFIFEMIKNEGLDWEYRNINVMNLRKYELPDKGDDYTEDLYESDEDEDGEEDMKALALKSLEEEALQYRLIKIRERSAHEYDYDKDDSFYSDQPQEFEYDIRGNRLPVGSLRDDLIEKDRDSYAHLSNSPKIAETLDEEIQRLSKLAEPESGKLIAYRNVFGKWPKGYPISKYDYL